jgi:hypothetical protein
MRQSNCYVIIYASDWKENNNTVLVLELVLVLYHTILFHLYFFQKWKRRKNLHFVAHLKKSSDHSK